MADPFLAEIRIFSGNFAPRNWAKCEGQLLPIVQNTALFSLLGTNYGGNGSTTFGLPDLRNRAPMHSGWGNGLTNRQLGDSGGSETVTLQAHQIPQHTHGVNAMSSLGTINTLQGNVLAAGSEDTYVAGGTKTPVGMSAGSIGASGGSQAHNNMQPYLVLTFIIALAGIYPPRP